MRRDWSARFSDANLGRPGQGGSTRSVTSPHLPPLRSNCLARRPLVAISTQMPADRSQYNKVNGYCSSRHRTRTFASCCCPRSTSCTLLISVIRTGASTDPTIRRGKMNDYIALLIGIICAGAGGELFVRGTVGTASALRISPGIIATTIAAFATSSPELTVAINSALHGAPRIALGDALGSNVVNVALILAAALLIAPITATRDMVRRDLPVALTVPVILAALLFDGALSQLDGLLLLGLFAGWLVAIIGEARRQRSAAGAVLGERKPLRAVIEGVAGLGLLIVAGRLIVTGATGIAEAQGIDAFIV